MRMVLIVVGALSMGLAVAAAKAQTAAVEWSSIAKTINGTCADGAIAKVTERAGSINIKFLYNGKQINELTFPLSMDGSIKSEFKGLAGRQMIEVAAGSGSRSMRIIQLDGACQWSYIPQ